ncbi:ISL3 family transposase [Streptomyces sp. BE20]|nr:ISL3 family transposase [Streptomyces sp. BE20]
MPCPMCGQSTGQVHAFHGRVIADVPVDGRRVVASVRIRRLVCPDLVCPRQTFREQVPGLIERYQRRTRRLSDQLSWIVKELAGRAGARLSRVLACAVSRSTALRLLMRQVAPPPRIPRVLGVDDFALKRRHRYATVLIDAETGERIDVLPDRTTRTLVAWLREHPGIEYVCRDGSGSYGEAIRQALPEAVQVSDRWHREQPVRESPGRGPLPRRLLGYRRKSRPARRRARADHPRALAAGPGPARPGRRPARMRPPPRRRTEHRQAVLRCWWVGRTSRMVLRYARMKEPTAERRAPSYKPTLVDPYRDHLRRRRAEEPAVPATHLLREIKELGYTGSANLLVRYITQDRVEGDKPVTTPQRFARLLLTRSENLRDKDTALLGALAAACPEMTQLSLMVREFANLLTPAEGNDAKLTDWITSVRSVDLPHLYSFRSHLIWACRLLAC